MVSAHGAWDTSAGRTGRFLEEAVLSREGANGSRSSSDAERPRHGLGNPRPAVRGFAGRVRHAFLSPENCPEGMAFWDMAAADVYGIRPAELVEAQKQGGARHREERRRDRVVDQLYGRAHQLHDGRRGRR